MKKVATILTSLGLLAIAGACSNSTSSTTTPGGGDAGPGGDCTVIETDCSAPLELKNADIKGGKVLPANTCYRVNENLSLSDGTLVLEEGVVLQFGTGNSIRVQSGGQLRMNGTCPHRVRLTSQDPVATWKGVSMDGTQGSDNLWTYAHVDRGGSDNWTGAAYSGAGVYVTDNTTVKMDYVTISGSKSHGLVALGGSDFTFEHGTFEGNVHPAYLHPDVVDRIPADTVMKDNENQYYRVVFGNNDKVTGDKTWAAHPYRIEDRFFIDGNLTIAAGAKLEFAQDVSVIVNAGGTLTAKGTSEKPVSLVGAATTAGFWQGIELKSGGVGSPPTIGATFDHVVLADAGGKNWNGNGESKAALFMQDTSAAAITNTTFKNSAYYGVWASMNARLPGFANNTFDSSARTMLLYPDRVGELGTNNTFSSMTDDTIHVVFGNNDRVSVAASWKNQGVAYKVLDRFFVEAPLTIEEGVTIQFPQDQGMIVKDMGALTVNGTAANPVVLRGQNEVNTGFWQGIHIQTNNPANKIQNATIAHAGVKGWNGGAESDAAIFLDDNTQITLTDVTLGPGGGYGVHLAGLGSTIGCSNVMFGTLVKGNIWKAQPGPGGVLVTCP